MHHPIVDCEFGGKSKKIVFADILMKISSLAGRNE